MAGRLVQMVGFSGRQLHLEGGQNRVAGICWGLIFGVASCQRLQPPIRLSHSLAFGGDFAASLFIFSKPMSSFMRAACGAVR